MRPVPTDLDRALEREFDELRRFIAEMAVQGTMLVQLLIKHPYSAWAADVLPEGTGRMMAYPLPLGPCEAAAGRALCAAIVAWVKKRPGGQVFRAATDEHGLLRVGMVVLPREDVDLLQIEIALTRPLPQIEGSAYGQCVTVDCRLSVRDVQAPMRVVILSESAAKDQLKALRTEWANRVEVVIVRDGDFLEALEELKKRWPDRKLTETTASRTAEFLRREDQKT